MLSSSDNWNWQSQPTCRSFSLWQKSILRWRASALGDLKGLLPNAGEAVSRRRHLFYCRILVGSRDENAPPCIQGIDGISPCGTNGAINQHNPPGRLPPATERRRRCFGKAGVK